VHRENTLTANVGGDGHGWVMRVQLFDHGGYFLHMGPDGRVVALGETFHFVTHTPEQQGRVVLVGQHIAPYPFELFGHALFVGVVETVSLVTQPVSYHHCQTQALGQVEEISGFFSHAPGSKRITA